MELCFQGGGEGRRGERRGGEGKGGEKRGKEGWVGYDGRDSIVDTYKLLELMP